MVSAEQETRSVPDALEWRGYERLQLPGFASWLGLFAQNTFLSAALKPWRLDPLQV